MTTTKNTLQTFTFTHGTLTATIRTIMIDGNPWFVAADTCRALGFTEDTGGGFGNATRPLTDNEKRTLHKAKTHSSDEGVFLFPGRTAHVRVISEAGLYKLVMRSDKPQARAFQDWVCGVVLPAIRKDGMYVMGDDPYVRHSDPVPRHHCRVAIVTRSFENMPFQFREDGWLNMTKAAQAFGKHIDDFLCRPETVEYFRELSGLDPENLGSILTGSQGRLRVASIKATGLIEVIRGRDKPQGTYGHPKVVVSFARWLDVRFAVFCDAVIHDLIGRKAELVITKPYMEELALSVGATDKGAMVPRM